MEILKGLCTKGGFIIIIFLFSCSKEREIIQKKEEVPEKNVLTEVWSEKIDAFFTSKHQLGEFDGVVLFAHCGDVYYKNVFGYSNRSKSEKLTDSSTFQLASVSKPLTALAVLQLYENGLVNLDENIKTYVPEFPYEGITVRMLLTHKSGLFNYMYFCDKYWSSWTEPLSNEDVLDLICIHKPSIWFQPGRKYNYSNTGFMLLALMVERVSGVTFQEYMENNIFLPVGMKQTKIFDACLFPEVRDEGALGYHNNGKEVEQSYLDGVVGDKGVYSTVDDLFMLDQALYTDKLVSQRYLDEAFEPQHPKLHIDDNYGLGWRLDYSRSEEKMVYHSGWWKGFKTHFIRVLPNQATIIVLSNKQKGFIKKQELLALVGY